MPSPSENPESKLIVTDAQKEGLVTIGPSAGLPSNVWFRLAEICGPTARRMRPDSEELTLPWSTALLVVPQIAKLRKLLNFEIQLDAASEAKFKRFQEERASVARARAATQTFTAAPTDGIDDKLKAAGFTGRTLKEFQRRDVVKLLAISNGANFSVPGAGKTTVALAVHVLTRHKDTALLVVAPKNAFAAWDETLTECIPSGAPDNNAAPFVRLGGDDETLAGQLFSKELKFLVTYERFTKSPSLFAEFLNRRSCHVVLDESHRIKAGEMSQRGQAVLSIATLPLRKDILSGTPIPHDVEDLIPQIDFLWPGQRAGAQLEEHTRPKLALRNLYVRTTKAELGLPPPKREFIRVPMAATHAAFYGILRDETLQQIAKIRHSQIDIVSARRSVIRLLQASTNPVSTLFKIIGGGEAAAVAPLTEALVSEGDSAKILKTCQLVRETVTNGKIVVWTIFTDTILRLEQLLADLSPLTLYGATPTGDIQDEETREGRVRMFHDSSRHNVLIANPAACSEGISLHRVCHEALYVDRSYNAAHYLQSVDRIHRIGLDPRVQTRIRILQSAAPQGIGSIDYSVSRRLLRKMEAMTSILDDEDIRAMALDEENAGEPSDDELTQDDIIDLLEQLSTGKTPQEDEGA